MPDTQKKHLEIPMTGKLILSDPATIGTNFQTLTNMRYTDTNIQSIAGNTKRNSTALSTYLKVRNGYHFKKFQPAENHLLVQTYNTGLTASQVLENTTAIPSTGDFSATAIHTDSAGAGRGYFAPAPGGQMVYCNGVDTCIWGGNEMKLGAFILSTAVVADDVSATNPRDYTEALQNTKTDNENVVNIGGGVDSYTKLMIHFDGDDEATADITATTGQTVSLEGDAKLDSAQKKFGTTSLYCDGVGDYATVPDSADWYFAADPFTIDCWIKASIANMSQGITGQYTDSSNYWYFQYYNVSLERRFEFKSVTGGVTQADYTWNITLTTEWTHIELARNGTNVYLFVNGSIGTPTIKTAISTNEILNSTGALEIGACSNHTTVASGWIDEFRVSKGVARHTTSFTVPAVAYSANGSYFLIGSPRPLKGIKAYVNVSNQDTATLTGSVWNGSTWDTLTLTDNTAISGKALAQTGTITFSSTVDSADPRYIEGYFLFWYQFYLSAGNCELYQITLDAPMQNIIDLWDGVFRDIGAFYKVSSTGAYDDLASNVYRDDYDEDVSETYANIHSMNTYSDNKNCLEVGFVDKMTGLQVRIPGDHGNTTAATTCAIDYWNGSSYASVGTITDGTSEDAISFAKSGVITWNNINLTDEMRHSELQSAVLGDEANTSVPLYFYRIRFDKEVLGSSSCRINYIGGISAKKTMEYYKFPVFAQGRVLLCADMAGDKNKAAVSGKFFPQVYNGADSVDLFFGDDGELTCGVEIFSQYGSNLYSMILMFKDNQTWVVSGQDITTWENTTFILSDSIGCPAPLTLKMINLAAEPGQGINRTLAIWQGSSGIYMSDGRAPIPIHHDIKKYFDRNDASCINLTKIGDSIGFVDSVNQEYHWLFASGSSTTLDKELVYDIKRNKWFDIDRGTGMDLQYGLSVEDTDGNQYTYGFIDTGYMERLEYGNTFDGNSIVSTFQLGDFAPLGLSYATQLDHLKLISVIPTTATDDVTCTHYTDTSSTGTDYTLDVSTTGYRLSKPAFDSKLQSEIYHSLKFTKTTDDEASGFKPIAVVATFHELSED